MRLYSRACPRPILCPRCVRQDADIGRFNCSYLLEHGLGKDGRPDPNAKDIGDPGSFETFFTETSSGKHVPRAIFMDLDCSPVDEIRTGDYRNLFHPELLMSGKEDAANNYARGHYTVGKEMIDNVMERVRRVTGEWRSPGGFLFECVELTEHAHQTTATRCKVSSSSTPSVAVLALDSVP